MVCSSFVSYIADALETSLLVMLDVSEISLERSSVVSHSVVFLVNHISRDQFTSKYSGEQKFKWRTSEVTKIDISSSLISIRLIGSHSYSGYSDGWSGHSNPLPRLVTET